MSKTIVNLALSIVLDKIETILETYPSHPYQQAFSIPDLRQKLVSYVLSRIPCHYTVIDDLGTAEVDLKNLYCSTEEDMHIETIIRQGIEHILQEDSDWVDHHIPEETDASFAPSTWFG
ncbi:MAG TPA: hypothetical protein V6C78_18355 [Crinalium sp.]|jgi:hypothetical protein